MNLLLDEEVDAVVNVDELSRLVSETVLGSKSRSVLDRLSKVLKGGSKASIGTRGRNAVKNSVGTVGDGLKERVEKSTRNG